MVVVPLFILLFASMLFIHHVVAKTQQTQLVARNAAWQKAMSGCAGGDEVTAPDFTSRMDGAPGSEVSLTASSGQASGSSDDNVSVSVLGSAHAAAGLSFNQHVHGKAIVMCNANTQPGDLPGVWHWFTSGDFLNDFLGGP